MPHFFRHWTHKQIFSGNFLEESIKFQVFRTNFFEFQTFFWEIDAWHANQARFLPLPKSPSVNTFSNLFSSFLLFNTTVMHFMNAFLSKYRNIYINILD